MVQRPKRCPGLNPYSIFFIPSIHTSPLVRSQKTVTRFVVSQLQV